MKRALALPLTAIATTAAMAVPVAAEAAAPGRYFSSCDALTRAWPKGVAKGPAAAAKAVRDGHSRPATTAKAKAVYWRNYTRLDRDRDGTACEN